EGRLSLGVPMATLFNRSILRYILTALVVGLLLGGGVAAYALFGADLHPLAGAAGETQARGDANSSHQLVRDAEGKPVEPPTLRLSKEAARTLDINADTTATVKAAR